MQCGGTVEYCTVMYYELLQSPASKGEGDWLPGRLSVCLSKSQCNRLPFAIQFSSHRALLATGSSRHGNQPSRNNNQRVYVVYVYVFP